MMLVADGSSSHLELTSDRAALSLHQLWTVLIWYENTPLHTGLLLEHMPQV